MRFWRRKELFLGLSKSHPHPFFSFMGPFFPSLALVYIYNFWRTLVVWPAEQDIPVGILMELDANAGNQTLKPSVSSEHKYRSEISFKKNEKDFCKKIQRWWWSTTKCLPTEGFLANRASFRHFQNSCLIKLFPGADLMCLSHTQILAQLIVCSDKGLFPPSCEMLSKLLWLWE